MKTCLIFALFVIFQAYALNDFAITIDSPPDKIKDQPSKCYMEEIGLFDKGDAIRVKDQCETVKCVDGGKYELRKCPPLIVEPPCWPVYALEKPFPECCSFEVKCNRLPQPTPAH